MAENPWAVESLQAFYFLKCPECNFDTKEENLFENHATENHPLSFVFFDKKSVNEDFGTIDIKEEPLSHYDTQISCNEKKCSRRNQISPIGCITEDNSMLIVPELESYVNEYELEDFKRDINNSETENYSTDDAIFGNNVIVCSPELKNLENHKINFGANNDIKCKEKLPERNIIVTNKSDDIYEKDPIHIAAKKKCLKIKTVKNSTNHHSASESRIHSIKNKEKLKRNIRKNSKTKECPHCSLSFERNSNLIRYVLKNIVLAYKLLVSKKLCFFSFFLVKYQIQSMKLKCNLQQ